MPPRKASSKRAAQERPLAARGAAKPASRAKAPASRKAAKSTTRRASPAAARTAKTTTPAPRNKPAAKPRAAGIRTPPSAPQHAGVSDAAVLRATGKPWSHWLSVLDRFDVFTHGHKLAALHLHEKHNVPNWWSQMIVVGYEHARGLRAPNQKTDGFSVSASRVIDAPPAHVFSLFTDAARRARWLPEPVVVHRATPHKSLRMTWTDQKKSISVNIYPRPDDRCSVQIQHDKLPGAAAAKRLKMLWADRIEALRDLAAETCPAR